MEQMTTISKNLFERLHEHLVNFSFTDSMFPFLIWKVVICGILEIIKAW